MCRLTKRRNAWICVVFSLKFFFVSEFFVFLQPSPRSTLSSCIFFWVVRRWEVSHNTSRIFSTIKTKKKISKNWLTNVAEAFLDINIQQQTADIAKHSAEATLDFSQNVQINAFAKKNGLVFQYFRSFDIRMRYGSVNVW